jgi:hypothetical protein
MKRRQMLLLLSSTAIFGIGGCSWWDGMTMRSQSPEPAEPETHSTRLVGDLARPFGTHGVPIEGVGLVTCLHHTGSDPGPDAYRSALLEEMQVRGVKNPNSLLASGNVSLVVVRGLLRPGIQKGDHFDVELRVGPQSETTSLRGGYLLETRLHESKVLYNENLKQRELHQGWVMGVAQGPVLIDPTADPKQERIKLCRGLVLGGGVAQKARSLGLVLPREHKSVANSARVAHAVNRRFHTYEKGIQVGVAKAQTDEYVELSVHPRYKEHVERYMRVLRAVALSETAYEKTQRIASLRVKLLDPNTVQQAALELEAIGKEAADTLCEAVASKSAEVRFYAAEALAYLDRREAAEPLGKIAREEPAFRVFALAALSTMQDFAAYEQLRSLLADPSAETRYGAFRALWLMNDRDPFVKGERFGDFHFHALDVGGPPLVHVTRSHIPEVVLFGREQHLTLPLALNAGTEILVTGTENHEISVSKYSVREGDQKRTVSTRLDDVIRAIVELGGTYPDVVQAIQEARMLGALASRFEVDALPEASRSYDRLAGDATTGAVPPNPAADSAAAVAPSADGAPKAAADKSSPSAAAAEKSADDDAPKRGFLARVFGR